MVNSLTRSSPRTRSLVAQCPENCSLRFEAIGSAVASALLGMREKGAGKMVMARRAAELLGRPVPQTNMQRHLAHYKEAVDESAPEEGPRPSDVSILDAIIAAGYRNSKNWKPGIKDTLDAIKLKTAMTGQSAFEDMLAAMSEGLDIADEEELGPENPDAVLSPDEREGLHGDDAG